MSRYIKMEVLMVGIAWAVSSFQSYVPSYPLNGLVCRYTGGCVDVGGLATRLSPNARIYYPGDEDFARLTARWSSYAPPNFTITVEVATEKDIIETVKFANEHKKPFVSVNNGHGAISTMGKIHGGIEIAMHKMKEIKIARDGKTATFGAGVLSKDVTDALWAKNKQTVTGGCECVSLIGPGLGGGHGFLQGRHGLISDQFVSLSLVTAEGTLLTVNKDHELWWALQGAGHNFGIVTSITSKIYDVKKPMWAFATFIFTGDKIEKLYSNINDKLLKNGTQEVRIINYSFFTNMAEVDANNPVIMFFILQEGAEAVDEQFTAPFTAIGPVSEQQGKGDYRDLPHITGNSNDQIFCQKTGLAALRFPIELQVYDISAQRKVYDTYNAGMKKTPELNNSIALFEGYSLQGVQAVPSQSTAYPFREGHLLVSPVIFFAPSSENIRKKAEALGTEMREILHKSSRQPALRSYVNYAFGNEGAKGWYGNEQWRQNKLRGLKKKYDPEGKFSFYAPIM